MIDWADATLGDVLDHAVRGNPHGDAVIHRNTRWSYQELSSRVDQCEAGLHRLGVSHGDRIAIWMVNRPEWLVTYLAAARLGAILVAINTKYTASECRHVLATAEANVVVVQDSFRDYH